MSIQSEIDRISGNVNDTMAVLSAAGVDTTGAGSNELPALVAMATSKNGAYKLTLGDPIVSERAINDNSNSAVSPTETLTEGDLYWIDCAYNYTDHPVGYNKMVGKVVGGVVSWNGTEISYDGTKITLTNTNTTTVVVTLAKVLEFEKLDIPFADIEGSDNIASGGDAHVEGFETQATNWNAHAEGRGTIASGPNSHAQGRMSKASGAGSHAEGYETEASGDYGSHAEGHKTKASGIYGSHAEGQSTKARGASSHAEGYLSEADKLAAHAEGYDTRANGEYGVHAEGYKTKATGNAAHAEGQFCEATNSASHAEGYKTKASSRFQHVQGKYNEEDTDNRYAHIVGNGIAEDERSNAHTLDWNGNAWFAGTVKDGTGRALVAQGANGAVAANKGGTGRTSLTSGYYLVGNGTGSVALKSRAQVLADIGAVSLEAFNALLARVEALEAGGGSAGDSTFTFNGDTYSFDSGMTWGEFINSSYNPAFECDSCGVNRKRFFETEGSVVAYAIESCYDCGGWSGVGDEEGSEVYPEDTIIANGNYYDAG